MFDSIDKLNSRNTRKKNCYDCRFCKYEEYGKGGWCQKEIFEVPISTIGRRYAEWEEVLGAYPFWAKNCALFKRGELQALKKKTLRALIDYTNATDEALIFESDFWMRNGFTYWMKEEPTE